MLNPSHPGEVLKEWLEGVSITDAAERLGVTRAALSRIVNGSAGISPAMDIRLSQSLGTTPGMWLRMQNAYDIAQELASAAKTRRKAKPMFSDQRVTKAA